MFFLFGILGGFLPVALIVLVIVAITAGRNEPDPKNERPKAIYLSALTYVGIFVALTGAFLSVSALVSYADDTTDGWSSYTDDYTIELGPVDEEGVVEGDFDDDMEVRGFEETDDKRDETSALIIGLITLAIGAGLTRYSEPELRKAAASSGPTASVYTRHIYFVSFTALAAALVAGGFMAFSLYGVVAPEWAGFHDRADAGSQLASTAALTLLALLVLKRYQQNLKAPAEPPAPPAPEPIAPVAKKAPAKKAATKKAATPRK